MDSASVNVVISGIGLSQHLQNSRWIGPNPSRGTLVHRASAVPLAQLLNAQGQLVAEVKDWQADEPWLLPSGLASGLYFIRCDSTHTSVWIYR